MKMKMAWLEEKTGIMNEKGKRDEKRDNNSDNYAGIRHGDDGPDKEI